MESPAADAGIVLNDALLNFLLDQGVLSPLPWIRFDRRSLDRTSFLRSLAVLGGVTKEVRLQAGFTVQLAALRLASYDVELASLKVLGAAKAESVLQAFDLNNDIFTNSWRAEVDIPIHLRSVPLDELQASEGQADAQNVWVTPTSR